MSRTIHQKLSSRMKRIIRDANKEGLQFIVLDDRLLIGPSGLIKVHKSIFGDKEFNTNGFVTVGAEMICISSKKDNK